MDRIIKESLYDFENEKLLLLGNKYFLGDSSNKNVIDKKLDGTNTGSIIGIWGHLKLHGASIENCTGHLEHSEIGNNKFRGITKEQVQLIKENHPEIEANGLEVLERFISFDEVVFPKPTGNFTYNEIPKVQLTLFLNSTEGAMVYQHLFEDEDELTTNEKHDGVDWEPILPFSTEGGTFDRDRLSYEFDVDYPFVLEANEDGTFKFGKEIEDRFVVKILTFKRDHGHSSSSYFERLKDKIVGIESKYEVLIFNKNKGWFQEISHGDIDPDKKTLLFIHGTLNDTAGSFSALRKQDWIRKELLPNTNFEQVLALEHPTVLDSVTENIEHFMEDFHKLLGNRSFSQPLTWVAASRGVLVAKQLANSYGPGKTNSFLKMGNGVMVGGANGAGLIDFLHNTRRGVGVLKEVLNPPGLKLFCELVQHSMKYLLDQPGLKDMKIGSDELKAILEPTQKDSDIEILPILADFNRDPKGFLLWRWFKKGIDLLLRPDLGKHHDLVIGCMEQFDPSPYRLSPTNTRLSLPHSTGDYEPHMVNGVHGSALKNGRIRKQVLFYLRQQ
jgi:hypothetical protein